MISSKRKEEGQIHSHDKKNLQLLPLGNFLTNLDDPHEVEKMKIRRLKSMELNKQGGGTINSF